MKWKDVVSSISKKDIESKLDSKLYAGDVFDLAIKSMFISNKIKFVEKYSKYFDETETEESLKEKADLIAKTLIDCKNNKKVTSFDQICEENKIKFLDANYISYKYMTEKDESYEDVSLNTWRNYFLYTEAYSILSEILLLYAAGKLTVVNPNHTNKKYRKGRFSDYVWKLTKYCKSWLIFPESWSKPPFINQPKNATYASKSWPVEEDGTLYNTFS